MTACCGEGDGAGEETDEVVHFGEEGAVETLREFAENGEIGVFGVREEMFADAVECFGPHGVVDGFLE